jgi:hypothetical protein
VLASYGTVRDRQSVTYHGAYAKRSGWWRTSPATDDLTHSNHPVRVMWAPPGVTENVALPRPIGPP